MQGARVFQSPTRYMQHKGLISHIGAVVAETFPKLQKPCIILSKRSKKSVQGQQLIASFKDPTVYEYDAECCKRGVQAVATTCEAGLIDHVICFGGGKIIDVGKLVADMLEAKSIVVPSVASNDSPCTALSVLYTEEGAFDEYKFFTKSPDMVLVDTQVILDSPTRFLIAGMGDALSTYYEARTCIRNPAASNLISPFIFRPPAMMEAIGKQCRDTLFEHGSAAIRSVESKMMDASFESVVEANILMSGLGAESGGLAGAHAIHNGIAELPESHKMLHGEKVAFGTLCQLVLEGDIEEAGKVAKFCKQVGLPTTFKDLGISINEDKLRIIANHCMGKTSTLWNVGPHVTHELLIKAMKDADALGASLMGHVLVGASS